MPDFQRRYVEGTGQVLNCGVKLHSLPVRGTIRKIIKKMKGTKKKMVKMMFKKKMMLIIKMMMMILKKMKMKKKKMRIRRR